MSNITNDGLTRSCTGCFIAVSVSIWQQWASKIVSLRLELQTLYYDLIFPSPVKMSIWTMRISYKLVTSCRVFKYRLSG